MVLLKRQIGILNRLLVGNEGSCTAWYNLHRLVQATLHRLNTVELLEVGVELDRVLAQVHAVCALEGD